MIEERVGLVSLLDKTARRSSRWPGQQTFPHGPAIHFQDALQCARHRVIRPRRYCWLSLRNIVFRLADNHVEGCSGTSISVMDTVTPDLVASEKPMFLRSSSRRIVRSSPCAWWQRESSLPRSFLPIVSVDIAHVFGQDKTEQRRRPTVVPANIGLAGRLVADADIESAGAGRKGRVS